MDPRFLLLASIALPEGSSYATGLEVPVTAGIALAAFCFGVLQYLLKVASEQGRQQEKLSRMVDAVELARLEGRLEGAISTLVRRAEGIEGWVDELRTRTTDLSNLLNSRHGTHEEPTRTPPPPTRRRSDRDGGSEG